MVALLKCQSDARLASATFHGAERLFMSQNAAGQPRALSFLFFSFSLTSIRSAQGVRKKESEEKRGTAEFAGRPGTRPRARRPFLGRSAPFVSAVAIEKEQQRGRVSRLLRPGRPHAGTDASCRHPAFCLLPFLLRSVPGHDLHVCAPSMSVIKNHPHMASW